MKQSQIFLAVVLTFFYGARPTDAQQPRSIFYMTREPRSVRSFLAHADKIDILSPAWYGLDSSGLLSGGPNPEVMETALRDHVPVMPLVVNGGFVQEEVHKFFANATARQQAIAAMVRAGKDNRYIGFHLDLENVNWTDRDALFDFVRETAAAFHKENLQLSIATIPNAPGHPGETGFSAWIYQNWRGAYDLKAIAQSVDFVCLMTYDQHTTWTAPGPVAGWNWTVANLDYALKVVPPQKLALGFRCTAITGLPVLRSRRPTKPAISPTQRPTTFPPMTRWTWPKPTVRTLIGIPWTGRRGCISTETMSASGFFIPMYACSKSATRWWRIAGYMALHRGCSEQRTPEFGICCQATNDFPVAHVKKQAAAKADSESQPIWSLRKQRLVA